MSLEIAIASVGSALLLVSRGEDSVPRYRGRKGEQTKGMKENEKLTNQAGQSGKEEHARIINAVPHSVLYLTV